MKLFSFLLTISLFSCGSGSKPHNMKNIKPENLQFFETYTMSEISLSWIAACDWVNEHDTLALQGKVSIGEINQRGLSALVHPTGNESMIGYVNEEDRNKVDSMLAIPEVKNNFFKNLRFLWSYNPEETENHQKFFTLFAIKVPEGNNAIINGKHLENVETGISEYTQQPVIRISMNQSGSHDWELMTRKNSGRAIAITLDNYVLSCPVVQDAIVGGETEINGNFTTAQAEELVARIIGGK
jgi:hypothetical protein